MKILIALTALALIFSGCDDKKGAQSRDNAKSAPASNLEQSGKIEIQKAGEPVKQDNSQFIIYDITGQKKVRFGLDEDNNVTRAVGAIAMVRSPLQSINLKLVKGKLSKNFILKCSACHDDYANGIIGPSLLSKSGDEIFSMIKAYKNKEKKNALMNDLVLQMSDEEVRALADEISAFNEQFRRAK